MKYLDASTFSKPVAYGKYVDNLYLPAQPTSQTWTTTLGLNFDPRADAIRYGRYSWIHWVEVVAFPHVQ